MKTIIEMAREVGLWPAVTDIFPKELEAFAELVRADERELVLAAAIDGAEHAARKAVADEREACAKVCDDKYAEYPEIDPDYAFALAASDLAKTIRARGNI